MGPHLSALEVQKDWQPRPQGFSLKKWVGKSPGDEVEGLGKGGRGREARQCKEANVKWRDKNSRLQAAERFLFELGRNEMRRAFLNTCAVRDWCELDALNTLTVLKQSIYEVEKQANRSTLETGEGCGANCFHFLAQTSALISVSSFFVTYEQSFPSARVNQVQV